MFSRRLIGVALLGLSALPAGAADSAAGDMAAPEVKVNDARVRQLLPGAHKTAGYFDMTNQGPEALTLVGARSDAAGAIEMHRTVHDGDIVRMRRVETVMVAPGETVRFQPGGLHLMLFRVTALPEPLTVELLTSTGERINAVFRQVPVGVE